MVERARVRWLPFSPWHLLLMPIALVMLMPLVWMVITRSRRSSETRHFPPIAVARHAAVANYPRGAASGAVRPLVL